MPAFDRIMNDLVPKIAEERIKQQIEREPTRDFWMKITGTTEAEMLEQEKNSDRTLIAAIIAYLEEKGL